jgi:hypothetical protein
MLLRTPAILVDLIVEELGPDGHGFFDYNRVETRYPLYNRERRSTTREATVAELSPTTDYLLRLLAD